MAWGIGRKCEGVRVRGCESLVGEAVGVAGEAAEEVGAAEVEFGLRRFCLEISEGGAEVSAAVGGGGMGAEEVGKGGGGGKAGVVHRGINLFEGKGIVADVVGPGNAI